MLLEPVGLQLLADAVGCASAGMLPSTLQDH